MPEKILIIDDDVDTLKLVGLMLQRQGYQIAAAPNGKMGLEHARTDIPDLILLDVMMPGMDGYEVARQLRANSETVNIPILMFTAKAQLDDKVSGFEAGADDYLTKPTHPVELQAHVKALLARSTKGKSNKPVTRPTEAMAYFIGVLAARGGLGVSTVALNLAASLLPKSSGEVIVVEMRPGQGTMGIDLNLASPGGGLTTLLNTSPNDITRARIREELVLHSSGLKFLLSSFDPSDCALANNTAQFEAIVQRLAFMGAFIILDLGPGLPTSTQKIVKHLSDLIIVAEPVPTSLIHTRALYQALPNAGIDKGKLNIIINTRIRSELNLSPAQAQEHLGQPIAVAVSPVPELINEGNLKRTAAVLARPESQFTAQFATMADQVLQRAPKTHRK
jgi:CheY-like chemotaxis protein/MinD-like ATPase involved in chromosome partitioning or flagellar assembly